MCYDLSMKRNRKKYSGYAALKHGAKGDRRSFLHSMKCLAKAKAAKDEDEISWWDKALEDSAVRLFRNRREMELEKDIKKFKKDFKAWRDGHGI